MNALTNMLEILGVLLSGEKTVVTKVTKDQAEDMINKAIIEYRETPNINSLGKDKVHAAIERVYEQVHSDVASFFDKEIAGEGLMAASQVAMTAASIFKSFPLVSVILDATALVTMAAATSLEIDIETIGSKIVVEANSLKSEIDKQPELAPVKKWNDARADEILIMGQLNAGMQDYRGDSSLYALISVIDQQTPGLKDDQLFNAVKKLCIDVNDLAGKLPNLGDKLYDVVSKENPDEIKKATQAMAEVSTGIGELVGAVVGTVIMSIILVCTYRQDSELIRRSWRALVGTEPIREGESLTRTMQTREKILAGTLALGNAVGAGFEIWQAVKTAEQKDEALSTIAKNRDAVMTFYDSLMSHVH